MGFNFISIVQLYGYQLFDDIQIPKGIDKGLLINAIMDKSAIYEPLYTDETLLKNKIQCEKTGDNRRKQEIIAGVYFLNQIHIDNRRIKCYKYFCVLSAPILFSLSPDCNKGV